MRPTWRLDLDGTNREAQLKGILDRGEKVSDIPPELYPFEKSFQPVPEPRHQDDWLHQFNESADTFPVRQPLLSNLTSLDLEETLLRLRVEGVRHGPFNQSNRSLVAESLRPESFTFVRWVTSKRMRTSPCRLLVSHDCPSRHTVDR